MNCPANSTLPHVQPYTPGASIPSTLAIPNKHPTQNNQNYDLSVFGFMYEFWTVPTTNITSIRSQNHTMVVGT